MKLKPFKINKKPKQTQNTCLQNALMVCKCKIRNSNYEWNLGSSFQMVLHYNSQLRKSIFAWAAALELVRDQPNLNFKVLPNLPKLEQKYFTKCLNFIKKNTNLYHFKTPLISTRNFQSSNNNYLGIILGSTFFFD